MIILTIIYICVYILCNLHKIIKIIGFQICGIGNGHLTQGKIIYDVLKKYYNIPIVIIYGRKKGFNKIFDKSTVIYKKYINTPITLLEKIKSFLYMIKKKKTFYYEQKYNINLWFNFLILDWVNYRTKQIQISHHISISDPEIDFLIKLNKLFSKSILVSILLPNKYSKYVLPPLINLKKILRKNIDKKLILAYSVNGIDFPNMLNILAHKYPKYIFHYFINYDLNINLEKNIILHSTSKTVFKKYLEKTSMVLCTAGNELILECVYNNIPHAIMPWHKSCNEQNFNCYKYCNLLKYSVRMNKNLKINKLNNMNFKKSNNFKKLFNNFDKKILKLCYI